MADLGKKKKVLFSLKFTEYMTHLAARCRAVEPSTPVTEASAPKSRSMLRINTLLCWAA